VPAAVPDGLLAAARAGDRGALARLISIIERGGEEARQVGRAAHGPGVDATTVGITGAPGAGKSTLTSALLETVRKGGDPIAVLAIDPSSPFSGGALLGDRVRMGELSGDPGVFIRSMATRGSLGGLAVHTAQVCDVLDAAGFSRILIETVGVGQSELEVAQTADSTAVVLVPESGDGVQAMKAGLMEIADVFVINKADREGAERGAYAVRSALELRQKQSEWEPPVLLTIASQGDGVDEVIEGFERHRAFLAEGGGLERRRRQRLEQRLRDLLRDTLWIEFSAAVPEVYWKDVIGRLAARDITPHQAAERLIGKAAEAQAG
jgi:LAO/AO transport system kinase